MAEIGFDFGVEGLGLTLKGLEEGDEMFPMEVIEDIRLCLGFEFAEGELPFTFRDVSDSLRTRFLGDGPGRLEITISQYRAIGYNHVLNVNFLRY